MNCDIGVRELEQQSRKYFHFQNIMRDMDIIIFLITGYLVLRLFLLQGCFWHQISIFEGTLMAQYGRCTREQILKETVCFYSYDYGSR